jgi:hypothetical protein
MRAARNSIFEVVLVCFAVTRRVAGLDVFSAPIQERLDLRCVEKRGLFPLISIEDAESADTIRHQANAVHFDDLIEVVRKIDF